jgi:hypothetical protein
VVLSDVGAVTGPRHSGAGAVLPVFIFDAAGRGERAGGPPRVAPADRACGGLQACASHRTRPSAPQCSSCPCQPNATQPPPRPQPDPVLLDGWRQAVALLGGPLGPAVVAVVSGGGAAVPTFFGCHQKRVTLDARALQRPVTAAVLSAGGWWSAGSVLLVVLVAAGVCGPRLKARLRQPPQLQCPAPALLPLASRGPPARPAPTFPQAGGSRTRPSFGPRPRAAAGGGSGLWGTRPLARCRPPLRCPLCSATRCAGTWW